MTGPCATGLTSKPLDDLLSHAFRLKIGGNLIDIRQHISEVQRGLCGPWAATTAVNLLLLMAQKPVFEVRRISTDRRHSLVSAFHRVTKEFCEKDGGMNLIQLRQSILALWRSRRYRTHQIELVQSLWTNSTLSPRWKIRTLNDWDESSLAMMPNEVKIVSGLILNSRSEELFSHMQILLQSNGPTVKLFDNNQVITATREGSHIQEGIELPKYRLKLTNPDENPNSATFFVPNSLTTISLQKRIHSKQ